MKILLVSNLYPPNFIGGYELAAYEVANLLGERGHQVFILTSYYGLERPKIEEKIYRLLNLFSKEYLKLPSKNKYLNIFWRNYIFFKNYFITSKLLKELKPDIIYVWNLADISIFPLLSAKKIKIPLVFHLMEYWLIKDPWLNTKNFLKKKILNYYPDYLDFKYLIAMSKTVKEEYIKAGFKKENIKVIYHGIDLQLSLRGSAEAIPNDKRYSQSHHQPSTIFKILYAGQVSKDKGVDVAIRAIAYLINELNIKNLQLDIIGTTINNYLEGIEEIIKEEKIKNYVNFLGKKNRDELLALYKNYDIFIMPSVWKEPFGIVILEAMANKVAVVASNLGGPKEIIVHKENGLLFEPGNYQELAENIKVLLEDLNLREKLKENAYQKLLIKFNLEKNVKLIEDYLQEVKNIESRNL